MATDAQRPLLPNLSEGDYQRFSQLVHELYGLNFPEKRRLDLEQGVRRAFAHSACANLDEYYQRLLEPHRGAESRQQLANALTIGESHFFRDAGQFDALYTRVLPSIIERRRSLRMLRVWSAGCAGGEEPYSIAILLRELLPDIDEWSITILGTDVNSEALERARQGLYSEWAFREARALHWRSRYFYPIGRHYQLRPEVVRMVQFAPLNLREDLYPSLRTNTTFIDLILCRNVTIYFTPAVTRQVIERFHNALNEEGWLVVGHSEHSLLTFRQFQTHSYPNAILYQKPGQPIPAFPDLEQPLTLNPPEETLPPPPKQVLPAPPPLREEPPPPVAPPSRPEDSLARARDQLTSGQSEQAHSLLKRFVIEYPQHSEAWALLGKASANLGLWQEAENQCRQAIRFDNLAQDPYYTLALILQHQNRLEEAVTAMKKVVYLDQNSIRGHYGLAILYQAQGKLPQALKALDNARKLLTKLNDADPIPDTEGLTAKSLRQAIQQHLRQWTGSED